MGTTIDASMLVESIGTLKSEIVTMIKESEREAASKFAEEHDLTSADQRLNDEIDNLRAQLKK